MKYILFIDATCKDYGIAMYLQTMQRALNIIHFVVPMILIIMATVGVFRLFLNPEDPQKKKWKSLINKFLAAVIIYFIPLLASIFFRLMPNSFDLANCWKYAEKVSYTTSSSKKTTKSSSGGGGNTISISPRKSVDSKTLKANDKSMKKIVTKQEVQTVNIETKTSEAKREAVVNYALQFVGKSYKLGGYWNGENPYTPTDCAGFIQGVYKHFCYTLSKSYWLTPSSGNIVSPVNINTLKKGDIIFYPKRRPGSYNHVAMYIGDGKKVHASSPSAGVIVSNKYDNRPITRVVRVIK